MSRWVRKWEITITWDRAAHSPLRTTRLHRHVDTVAALRCLVEAARSDPHVTSIRYGQVRVCDGPRPTHCRRGHPHAGGSATRVDLDHVDCTCGGHLLLICRWPGCGDVILDPVPEVDCQPQVKPQQQVLVTRALAAATLP